MNNWIKKTSFRQTWIKVRFTVICESDMQLFKRRFTESDVYRAENF